ncbi:MAG: hypothetical protein AAF291_12425 [Pseudomonadota bacterium]
MAVSAHAAPPQGNPEPPETPSDFVGRYNGSSFETAMGMEILADGTWRWGLSVGALDMRAKGTWQRRGDTLVLASAPVPVAPEFAWSRLDPVSAAPDKSSNAAPYLRVVWSTNFEPFPYASVELQCRNGETFSGQIHRDGYPSAIALEYQDPPPPERDPRQSCDVPTTATLVQSVYNVRSQPFDLAAMGWEPGRTARFVFSPNDMGVADFTGVTGSLSDGTLTLVGGEWPMELRKLPPAKSAETPASGED